jgi:serine/threonine-protein kinase
MHALWPEEPAVQRREFSVLVERAMRASRDEPTPSSPQVASVLARASSTDARVLPGTAYRLLRKLGEGASADVFEAEHVELRRRVAIKVLRDGQMSDGAVARFRKEAQTLARLHHPSVVSPHDFGHTLDGRAYLVMDTMDGEAASDRVEREGPVCWQDAVGIALQVAAGMGALHALGFVHRDVSPANILLGDHGRALLLDCGIAAEVGECPHEAGLFGTPSAMAPEQITGGAVSAATDVYGLGCSLYTLLTGMPVFDGGSLQDTLGMHLSALPVPPSERTPWRPAMAVVHDGASLPVIPRAVDRVVLRALEKDPAARFPTSEAFAMALRRVLDAPARRRSAVRVAAGALVAAAGLVGAVSFGKSLPSPTGTPVAGAPTPFATTSPATAAMTPPTDALPPPARIVEPPQESPSIRAATRAPGKAAKRATGR